MRTIWWDMDGTIANLYEVENWLPKLQAEDPTPYIDAKVMCNMSQLARLMNQAQTMGYKLGIISWTAKNCTQSYHDIIRQGKLAWLNHHLPSVRWDYVCIVSYGTPKSLVMETEDDILFDDEVKNREDWLGEAFTPQDMIRVLKALLGKNW